MKKALLTLSLLAAASWASANILVTYSFNNTLAGVASGSAGLVSDTDISLGNITRNNTTVLASAAYRTDSDSLVPAGETAWRAGSSRDNPAGNAGPDGTNVYIFFNITNNGTDAVNISSYSIDFTANGGSRALTSVVIGATETIIGGDPSAIVTTNAFTTLAYTAGVDAFAAPISLASGSTAQIRQYVASNQTNRFWYFDDMEVTLAPVPEPSTFALLAGFLALGLAMWRRRSISG